MYRPTITDVLVAEFVGVLLLGSLGSLLVGGGAVVRTRSPRMQTSGWMVVRPPRMMFWVP